MNRPCGCASAEQCWKQCCCFSNQQKVAWAEQNDVKVPEYVITAAKQEATEQVVAGRNTAASACCSNCDKPAHGDSSTVSKTGLQTKTGQCVETELLTEICSLASDSCAAMHPESGGRHEQPSPAECGCRAECDVDSANSAARVDVVASSSPDDAALEQPGNTSPEKSANDTAPGYVCAVSALECRGLTSLWDLLSVTMLPWSPSVAVAGSGFESGVVPFESVLSGCDRPSPEPPPRLGVTGLRAV